MATVVGLASEGAAADDPHPATHELIDLGRLPGGSGSSAAFGLNNDLTVVGWAGGITDVQRAFIWFLCSPGPAFPAYTMIDLSELAGHAPGQGELPSMAYEVNDATIVVGQQFIWDGNQVGRGQVWDPLGDQFSLIPLLTTMSGASNVATSISNGEEPWVAGYSTVEEECLTYTNPEDPAYEPPSHAFVGALAFPMGTPTELPPLGGDPTEQVSNAFSVVEVGTPAAALVFGVSSPCHDADDCLPTLDATRWSIGASGVALGETTPSTLDVDGSTALGGNDAGMAVGWIRWDEEVQCKPHAALWPGDGTVTDIADASGYLEEYPDSKTEARAITEPDGEGVVWVVGNDLAYNHAVLWIGTPEGDGYVWTWKLVAELAGTHSLEVIDTAYDVADDGSIVGQGIDGGAVLLRTLAPVAPGQSPFRCPGDVDYDWDIDGQDLAILIGAWGSGPFLNPKSDVDNDLDVDAADLALLLGAWAATCDCELGFAAAIAASESSASEATTALPAGLQAAIATMGFGSIESLNAWAAEATVADRESVFNAIALILMASPEGG